MRKNSRNKKVQMRELRPITQILSENERPTVEQLICTDSAQTSLETARLRLPHRVIIIAIQENGTWGIITNSGRDTTYTMLSKAAQTILDTVDECGNPNDDDDDGIECIS